MKNLNLSLALFALLLALAMTKTCVGFLGVDRYYVSLVNDMASNNAIDVHCQSKNDDLGPHDLARNGSFRFTFKTNFWGTTLYWCSCNLPSHHGSFDVFRDDTYFHDRCSTMSKNCSWSLRDDGAYLYNSMRNTFELQTSWN